MPTPQTEVEFEKLSWHDCHIWRFDLQVGDPDEDDWTSDLVIGVDFIVEWLCGVDRSVKFKIAPATLVFHGVTDPRIAINWGDTGFQASIFEPSIGEIVREQVKDQKVFLDRPYYRWRIELNWPDGGEITFGAAGFTQTLLAEPVVCDRQHLSLKERSRLTGR
jgi:hypothetical protein